MFAATTKKSWLLTDIADTCDVLEEAVNTAFEGRPGPVHIHVPVSLTHRGKKVENYHDIRLDVEQVLPDPGRVEAIASTLADALRKDKPIVALVGFGAIRSGAGPEVRRFIERFQIPLLTTLDGKGIVSENHPLSVGVFSDSGHSSAWKAFREAKVVVAIGNALNQHATFNYRDDLFTDKLLIHINISETEIDKAYKADHALVADAKPAVAAITDALDKLVGPLAPRRSTGATTRPAASPTWPASSPRRSTPASSPRRSAGCCPRTGSSSPTPAPTPPGSATTSSSKRARTSARPASSGRWPGTSTAPSG